MQPSSNDNSQQWSYHPENGGPETPNNSSKGSTQHPTEPVSWSGSEFISNNKSFGWYAVFGGVIVGLSILIYLISKDISSIFFVVVMGILFAIMASRKPRQLNFTIDNNGIYVGQKLYAFSDFLSFSLQRDGAIGYISLLPLHRFRNELSIYYAPDDEQKIFDALSNQLPHEQRSETIIDKLIKLIRF